MGEWQLSEFEDRAFGTLSDGERKRVQIARSVMTDPELLLLDEPVASLDLAARELTLQLLSGYAQATEAPAMVMVTHHLEEIPPGLTHALLLQDGKVMSRGDIGMHLPSASISDPFHHPLTLTYQNQTFSATPA